MVKNLDNEKDEGILIFLSIIMFIGIFVLGFYFMQPKKVLSINNSCYVEEVHYDKTWDSQKEDEVESTFLTAKINGVERNYKSNKRIGLVIGDCSITHLKGEIAGFEYIEIKQHNNSYTIYEY